ncbi:hypothetical protein [Kitasatospora sp. CB01950]|uniref:hypothetical protein n=1 Tax=Kitasatospora sp. CB01950 TaxID=1703930 RepID=UPI00093A7CD8|nr:hypothetical protein [Kitasatospora sp. CB01950]OKI95120.1 hypothetical protein AMK19_33185 [Kitasatospora sp. CB01950]
MTTHQKFLGHRFTAAVDLDETDPEHIDVIGVVARCSCGWGSDTVHTSGLDPQAEEDARFEDPGERDAEREWRDTHLPSVAATAVPAEAAAAVQTVVDRIRDLTENGKPMAALALIRLTDGGFPAETRAAAQQASFQDYSWTQIGDVLGLSKQTAWERYGRDEEPVDPAAHATQKAALEAAVRAESGNWDASRVTSVLVSAGHQVNAKRARQLLRDLADADVLQRAVPGRAVYARNYAALLTNLE